MQQNKPHALSTQELLTYMGGLLLLFFGGLGLLIAEGVHPSKTLTSWAMLATWAIAVPWALSAHRAVRAFTLLIACIGGPMLVYGGLAIAVRVTAKTPVSYEIVTTNPVRRVISNSKGRHPNCNSGHYVSAKDPLTGADRSLCAWPSKEPSQKTFLVTAKQGPLGVQILSTRYQSAVDLEPPRLP